MEQPTPKGVKLKYHSVPSRNSLAPNELDQRLNTVPVETAWSQQNQAKVPIKYSQTNKVLVRKGLILKIDLE